MRNRFGVFIVGSLLAALLIAGGVASSPASAQSNCLNLGSEQIAPGDVTDDDWNNWTGIDLDFASNEQYLQVQGTSDDLVLRQRFEPSSQGSARVTVKGDLAPAPTYRMTQRVFFEPGFDWGRDKQGGKLGFGLGGGSSPTGGDIDPNGFSARFMWRGNGDGTAGIVVYSYAADRDQNLPFGDDLPLSGFTAPIGSWFTLTMEVTANSAAGVADGSVRAWADGELALDQDGILWQDAGLPVVDRFIYASFYGGNSWDWAPSQTTYAQFDDVCWDPGSGEPEPTATPTVSPTPEPTIAPTADGLQGRVRSVEAAIEGLLPSGSGQVDWRLNYALDQVAEASDSTQWLTSDELHPESDALRDLQRGVAKLLSAADSSGASPTVRDASLDHANELAAVAIALGNDAVSEAELALAENDCDCRSARRQLDRALTEQESIATASDAADATNYARRAWSRAQLALAAIS